MVTIYDIAKKVGCASSTVSRALGDVPGVKEQTKKKILEAARELEYVPDYTAKNLKTKRSWNIGVIMYAGDMIGLTHYLFADILNSFAEVIESENYDLTLVSRNLVMSNKSLLAHCKSKHFDGVFIVCGDFSTQPIKELLESNIPLVAVDYYNSDEKNIHCVTSDNRRKMFDLTDYVLSMGHKNIVYITGRDIFVTEERVKGFKAALKANGLRLDDSMLLAADYYNLDKCYDVVKQVLSRKNRPTAIFMPDDYSAISAYDAAREMGLSIPEDVSIVGFDGLEICAKLYPPMTTVKQDTKKLGGDAANILLDLINEKNLEEQYLHVVKGALIKGGSVANCKLKN